MASMRVYVCVWVYTVCMLFYRCSWAAWWSSPLSEHFTCVVYVPEWVLDTRHPVGASCMWLIEVQIKQATIHDYWYEKHFLWCPICKKAAETINPPCDAPIYFILERHGLFLQGCCWIHVCWKTNLDAYVMPSSLQFTTAPPQIPGWL